jgi:hypothetical protein
MILNRRQWVEATVTPCPFAPSSRETLAGKDSPEFGERIDGELRVDQASRSSSGPTTEFCPRAVGCYP